MCEERQLVMTLDNESRNALKETLKEVHAEINGKNVYYEAFLKILQIVIAPLLAWLLWNSVAIQKDIVQIKANIQHNTERLIENNENLEKHMNISEDAKNTSLLLHHNFERAPDCRKCHEVTTAIVDKSRSGIDRSNNKR